MKENEDKHLEKLVSKVMKDSTLETPSFDFTSHIMQHVVGVSKTTLYKPLISKAGWFCLIISVLIATVVLGINEGVQNSNWFNTINFSLLTSFELPNVFSRIQFSHTSLYAFILFGIMACIQVPLLKSYFDKRLDV